MVSVKQVEGFLWVAELGGMERAAEKLHTTQSAISKRVAELEATVGVALFDRAERRIRLTIEGEALLGAARDMLDARDRFRRFRDTRPRERRTVRLGVTELTAATWLPLLVKRLRVDHAELDLEPFVDSSGRLVERLHADELDLAVVPDAFRHADLRTIPLGMVDYAWMCAPDYPVASSSLSLQALVRHTLIEQVHASGLGDLLRRWMDEQRVVAANRLSSSSLAAVAALTLSGLGISALPRAAFAPLVAAGRLREIASRPRLPRVGYVAASRRACSDGTVVAVTAVAAESCDFARPFGGGL